MRIFVTLALGIVIGVAIGAVPAENWFSTVKSHAEQEAKADCRKNDFSGVVGGMLEDAGRRNEPIRAPAIAPDDTDAPPVAVASDAPPDAPPMDIEQEVSAAKTALEARRTQARAALIEDAGLDDAQLAAIDEATAVMNAELMALTDDLVADIQQNGQPSRRDTMVYAAEALDVMINAEDRMNAALDDTQRADAAPESLDPLSYVDPAIVDHVRALRELGAGNGP
jgi:hypothetical protein